MGQTVVPTTTVSVVKYVVRSRAGQLVTVEGQAVIVLVRVVKIVEVVNCDPEPEPEPGRPEPEPESELGWPESG